MILFFFGLVTGVGLCLCFVFAVGSIVSTDYAPPRELSHFNLPCLDAAAGEQCCPTSGLSLSNR
jgi:hypothetical protein